MNSQQMLVPFPFPVPQAEPQIGEQVPARVQVAMRLLAQLDGKTRQVVAGNDMSLESFDGAKLVHEEEQAQASALALLTKYFDGTLRPTETERRGKGRKGGRPKGAVEVHCPMCRNIAEQKQYCLACGGTGSMLMMRTE